MNIFPKDALGIVLSTVTDSHAQELVSTARLAEQAGFHSVFVNEGRGDALSAVLAMALATESITLGTNIANIYFRHPFLLAGTARTIAELSNGRLILGLGMSHRGLLKSLGIDMGNARQKLADYVTSVKNTLAGNAGEGFLRAPAAAFDIPIYVAANTIESADVAGRTGDGVMPFLSPRSYLPSLLKRATEAHGGTQLPCVLSIPTFISDDEQAALSAAKYNLAFFSLLPNYRRQWRRAGFKAPMDLIQARAKTHSRRELSEFIPDDLVDEVCIFGNLKRCQRQIEGFRKAGADLPVLAVSPVNDNRQSATEHAIRQFGKN